MAEKWHLGYNKIISLAGQESSIRTNLRTIKAKLYISKTITDFDRLCPPGEPNSVEDIIERIEEFSMLDRDGSWTSEGIRSLFEFVVKIAIAPRLARDLGHDVKNLDGSAEDGAALDKLLDDSCATITGIFSYRFHR